jgi:hypothetical protein
MQVNIVSTVAPFAASQAAGTTSKSSQAGATSASATAPAARSAPSPAPQQSEAAAVSTATATLPSSVYSVTVAGKSYSANVSDSNGSYTVSVPNIPGAHVSGPSLSAAESALSAKIDVLA